MCTFHLVSDAALPPGHDFLLVQAEGRQVAFVRESTASPSVVEDIWHAACVLASAVPRRLRSA